MDHDENLSYFLTLSKIKGIGAVKFNQILQKNNKLGISLKDFFKLNVMDLRTNYPFLQSVSGESILNHESKLFEEIKTLKMLCKLSIRVITTLDKTYPSRLREGLGNSSPPILYVRGNLDLLNQRQFAIVGTRNPTREAIQITKLASIIFSQNQFTITSGYADGIDIIAHNTALELGGTTIFVLGSGMFHSSEKSINDNKHSNTNCLFISEFHPTFPWHKGYLMTRNRTICALADGVLVVEAKENGGAYYTGNYALMMNKLVYTTAFENKTNHNSGNTMLIKKGAIAIPFRDNELDEISSNFEQIAGELKSSKSLYINNKSLSQYKLFHNNEDHK